MRRRQELRQRREERGGQGTGEKAFRHPSCGCLSTRNLRQVKEPVGDSSTLAQDTPVEGEGSRIEASASCPVLLPHLDSCRQRNCSFHRLRLDHLLHTCSDRSNAACILSSSGLSITGMILCCWNLKEMVPKALNLSLIYQRKLVSRCPCAPDGQFSNT